MKRKRLLWQIFPPMLVVIAVAVIGTTVFASKSLRKFHLEQTTADLVIRAQLVLEQLRHDFVSAEYTVLAERCRAKASQVRARITLILADGEIVADSEEDPVRMDNHADRQEIAEALKGGRGSSIRFSRTIGREMLYVALPVYEVDMMGRMEQKVFGVVRLSVPLVSVDTVLRGIIWENIFGAVVLVVIAAAITLIVSRKISRPLEEMARVSGQYGALDFSRKISFSDKDSVSREVGGLAETINTMAVELGRRIDTVTRQKNELEAVFKSMVEGVIVVDTRERLVHANDTAVGIFKTTSDHVIGRKIAEAFRDADLSRFIREILAGDTYLEKELIFLQGDTERYFHAGGTLLHDGSDKTIGALVVLNDVTRTRKLENMRREFVANVSHELKTPITSIGGFVETLIDGALENKEDARRFLEIIQKQANRLNAIVDDLLSLSRIEQEEEQGAVELKELALRPILENCLESCAVKAQKKEITLKLDCDPQISAPINQRLLEQAVINLLVNAIKYSSEKSQVQINVLQVSGEVCIKVIDQGCGIDRQHLPRLFERFYRSDKARSRKLGGTGLGLAIVKHIVNAHGGEVEVQSQLDKGSTFSILLRKYPGKEQKTDLQNHKGQVRGAETPP